jgi:hypothetical protein
VSPCAWDTAHRPWQSGVPGGSAATAGRGPWSLPGSPGGPRHRRARCCLSQVTTPVGCRLSPEQTITVIDPRHPLCGRTLTLITMTYHADLGHCCVVWLRPQVERLVPVGATNLAFNPNDISPTPLSVDAVEQLLRVVHDIQHASKGVSSDASPARPSSTAARARRPDCSPSAVGTPLNHSATARPQGSRRRRATVAGSSAQPTAH